MSNVAHKQQAHGHAGGHEHGHNPHLAHHFDTPEQQFESGKLGIWLFLVQEVLFFSGLFCAYAVYRSNHPEIFVYAHRFLDVNMGALNTGVLIFSSLTAAWAVRCAQLNQRRGLILNLSITLLCAFIFLGVKYVEYSHKWHDGLLWGKNYRPHQSAPAHGEAAPAAPAEGTSLAATKPGDHAPAGGHAVMDEPKNVHIFFGIYFAMTGLHGLHVIAGIIVFVWILIRAIKGEFNSEHFAAIDFAALYWHLVDLVWIYLFPLLYLIH